VEDDRLRKLGTTLLALPVLTLIYLVVAARSAGRFRAAGFVGAAGLIALVLMVGGRPATSAAAPQSLTRTVSAELLDTVLTGHGLKAPVAIGFDAPMDAASVAAALRVAPEAAVTFTWDAEGKTLTIAPVKSWAPDTLYSITVDASARAADGSPMAGPIHAVVLTAKGGSATLSASKMVGKRVAVDTAFAMHLDRAVALEAVQAALTTDPAVSGTVSAGTGDGNYVFTPDAPLSPNTAYRVSLAGLVDSDGIAFAAIPSILVRTTAAPAARAAPAVVRFRPANGATAQDRASVLSVRFSGKMNRRATAAALKVTAAGKVIAGKVTWAESDHVLVFTPAAALPYGAKVTITISAAAASATGVAIDAAAKGSFSVKAKPAVRKPPTPAKKPAPKPIPHPGGSGGSGGVSGSWHSVEVYYLNLMNCTRTGGWVTSSGKCSSPGGRSVAPLKLSAGISTKVSRPYAKYLAQRNLCNHFYDGTPGDRLRRAGYTSYNWGENIGCENLSPYNAVLGDHLFFQSEKPYNGGHYVNLMNKLYTQVGIGVWVSSGRVRLVIDFYKP
jgi:uncharacterized protein YkwD/methionine-rich copper-binding protein CopC